MFRVDEVPTHWYGQRFDSVQIRKENESHLLHTGLLYIAVPGALCDDYRVLTPKEWASDRTIGGTPQPLPQGLAQFATKQEAVSWAIAYLALTGSGIETNNG